MVTKKNFIDSSFFFFFLSFVCTNRLQQKVLKESNGCKQKLFIVNSLKWLQENSLLLNVDSGSSEVIQEWEGKELGVPGMGEIIHS